MAGAADRASTRKLGPRALTMVLGAPNAVWNCRKTLPQVLHTFILGEAGTPESAKPLVHGWYRLTVVPTPEVGGGSVGIWVQQVTSAEALATDPSRTGQFLQGGESFDFFVDDSSLDSVLVLLQCGSPSGNQVCLLDPVPLATVNRLDTVRPPSATGNTSSVTASQARKSTQPC